MATYKIGSSTRTRLNALGGAQYAARNPSTNATTNSAAMLYYVVSRGFAGKLQGFKAGTSSNGTLYAVFNTSEQAYTYVKRNKMRLYTSVVTLPVSI